MVRRQSQSPADNLPHGQVQINDQTMSSQSFPRLDHAEATFLKRSFWSSYMPRYSRFFIQGSPRLINTGKCHSEPNLTLTLPLLQSGPGTKYAPHLLFQSPCPMQVCSVLSSRKPSLIFIHRSKPSGSSNSAPNNFLLVAAHLFSQVPTLTSCLLKFWTHCSNCSSFVSSAFPSF